MHRDYPQIINGWFYTENTRVKKVIHNQVISCVFRLLTIGISIFFIHRRKRKSIDFYEFSTCALVVWKTFFDNCVFLFFLFVDCVDNCKLKNFFLRFLWKTIEKNAKLVLVIHFLMKEEALYGIPRCFME